MTNYEDGKQVNYVLKTDLIWILNESKTFNSSEGRNVVLTWWQKVLDLFQGRLDEL